MIDLEEQLERHLHLVAGRAEPIPDVQAVFADEPQRRSMTSQLSRRSWLPAAAAVVVVVVGVVGMAAMSDLRSPSGADEPSATVATSPDNTSEVSAGPVEVPGMTSVRSSESTAESSVFAQSLLVLLADEYPELELREDATRTTESGHEVTWVYLLDGERRLFVVAGKSGLLDTTGLRRTADGFEWPNEAGIVTTAVSNAGSIAIVRSESIDPDGQARTIDDVHRIAELAASLPTPVSPAPVAPSLDLDGVPPVSAPLVLSQYLNEVQFAVRNDVGDDVFGGAIAQDADTDAMTLTIFGTDADAVIDAVDRIATDERGRITVVRSQYSVSDLERFASEAQSRLDAVGIEAYVMIRWGIDAVDVNLVTPDGEPDSAIEERAVDALGDIPNVVSFSPPMTPLVPATDS